MITQRLINVRFKRARGSFSEGGNEVLLSGLRVSCSIIKAGGNSMGTAEFKVYGMTLSLMNQLSTLGMKIQLQPRDLVSIEAGTEGQMSTVFIGSVYSAYADLQAAPDVSLVVLAHTGGWESVTSADPLSFQGSTDVGQIMSGLATKMGLAFENSGVNVKLSSPYFFGSPRNQAQACAIAADINWSIDDGKLAIWPKNGARNGAATLVSPRTGMVGYPSYTAQGIMVRSLWNPNIGFGGKIQVESDLKPACGTWTVFGLAHNLDSKAPRGQWFSTIQAYNQNFVGPVVR